ncbi:dihydroorotate dehydrogenase putative [Prevotella sp. CAG:873]|jgi:dihydroorotate dehydrogenase electron transfer subunit|nr:dihydroorotate dehydrogenase putative [Prevotella sp. CAG:873]
MPKVLKNMRVVANRQLSPKLSLLTLVTADGGTLPEILPGQFVQVDIPDSKSTFLRRPISICDVTGNDGIVLMVRDAGAGTHALCQCRPDSILSVLLPLGGGTFPTDLPKDSRVLLVGGGVGVAPLLYYAKTLIAKGISTEFVLGGRSISDLPMASDYATVAPVHITTDDGSAGVNGVVTSHPRLAEAEGDTFWAVCGPMPMMKAVASLARGKGIRCLVSLENTMACGVGACLCCVTPDAEDNHVCVCTAGPVFDTSTLKWNE